MKQRISWIVLDFVLATLVAVLGNIVASFLQERFDLTDPARFTFVAIVFVICFGLLLLVTVKRSRPEESRQGGNKAQIGARVVNVQQRAQKLLGKLTGAEIGKISEGEVKIKQKIDTVGESGEAIGFEAQELSGGNVITNQSVDQVDVGGIVTGASIDEL